VLQVPDSGHVFDDDDVVWVLTLDVFNFLTNRSRWSRHEYWSNRSGRTGCTLFGFNLSLSLVQQVIGRGHVINDAALRDLLATELMLGAKAVPVIVTEVIEAHDGKWLDSEIDKKLCQYALELRLP
jgi:hypothetical protein